MSFKMQLSTSFTPGESHDIKLRNLFHIFRKHSTENIPSSFAHRLSMPKKIKASSVQLEEKDEINFGSWTRLQQEPDG